MNPKVIMVPFSGKDNEMPALEIAAELAKKYQAHIDIWHVLPDPYTAAAAFSASFGLGVAYIPDAFVDEQQKRNKAAREKAQKKYARFLRIMAIPQRETLTSPTGVTASFHVAEGPANEILAIQARLADMVVISRAYNEDLLTSYDVTQSLVFDSGRSVMLVPSGKHAKSLGNRALIAWNGSPQATRAVSAALPLLANGEAQVISALEPESKRFAISPHELAMYLAYHDVKAKPVLSRQKGAKAAVSLLQAAKKFNAGFLVMGAYTHSRAREMVLGGVTSYMLKNATLPVLMVH